MDDNKKLIEALIFSTPKPIGIKDLVKITGLSSSEIEEIVDILKKDFEDHGFNLVRTNFGFQFRTKDEFAPWIRKISGVKKIKLSNAAMEVLAIVAYKQPVTRAEINSLRQQDSDSIVRQLLERGLLVISGKKKGTGGAQLLETSKFFLEIFNLKSLDDLPPLDEIKTLYRDKIVSKQLDLVELDEIE